MKKLRCSQGAGGFLMYFTENQVKSLLLKMAKNFPQSELIFDSIPIKGIKYANRMLDQAKMSNAILQWGLDYGVELENWSTNIKLVSQIPYF